MADVEKDPSPDRRLYAGFMGQFKEQAVSTLVDQARMLARALNACSEIDFDGDFRNAAALLLQLADRVQELEASLGMTQVQLDTKISINERLFQTVQEQQRTIAALNDAIGGPGSLTTDNLTVVGRLEARVQELEGKGEPVAYCCPDDPNSSTAFAWPGSERTKRHSMPLFASPPSSVQPEKERGPITAQQVLAAAVCHERGRVVISTVQRTLHIGYREADELCRSIIAAGLVDGLEISTVLQPISPSPSMVGREGEAG